MRWPVFAHRIPETAPSVAPPSAALQAVWQLGGHLPALAPDRLPAAVHLPGDQRAVRLGQGMDFEQLRPYQAGEPANRIDWRISARGQVPMVRIFREPAQRQCHLLLDTAASMLFGTRQQLKITQALLVGQLLTAAALQQNLAVSLHTPGIPSLPDRHPSTQRAQLLHRWQAIASALDTGSGGDIDWPGLRGRLYAQVPPGQILIVLGDFLTDTATDPALMGWVPLASRHRLILVSLYDPAEVHLPDVGRATFVGHPTPQRVNTHDPALRARLTAQFDARQQALTALAQSTQGHHVAIPTTLNPEGLLTAFSDALAVSA
ncbi:DUF58 domain-containing protein [Halothiobacillus sp. DCM-1]|uniref:DUF58 domain-containing protein n=1 Tax=Halothiobacillus sp. DCM-1 TaxID=3112558 RepID=UPI00324B6DC3